MSARIKYAYLKDQTWLYRRNYPEDVALLLGSSALKQSLKTGDVKTARARAAEVNLKYEDVVARCRRGAENALSRVPQSATLVTGSDSGWGDNTDSTLVRLRAALVAEKLDVTPVVFSKAAAAKPEVRVGELARQYLNKRSNELRPGGFKSVRYSVDLFASKFGDRPVTSLGREDGQLFLSLIAQLAVVIGKSERSRGLGLDALLRYSRGKTTITVRTQKRIWSQVNHLLDWCVYEGQLEANPFRTVPFNQKVRPSPYAVLTDVEVTALLREQDRVLHHPLLVCLLTGMRAGEAAGLLREDVISKGNLGSFIHVRPNNLRDLKTDAADRLVPVHPVLEGVLRVLPSQGPLFPGLMVNSITKRFSAIRKDLGIERPGVVFHSTRKWFITQCERTGVPEHFTASLVGHKSARSENGITYGIYSAGNLGRAEAGYRRPDPATVWNRDMIPDIEEFEERAAIAQYDGGLSRRAAEDLAAREQGFEDAQTYWKWLADYVVERRLTR